VEEMNLSVIYMQAQSCECSRMHPVLGLAYGTGGTKVPVKSLARLVDRPYNSLSAWPEGHVKDT
jgi:hypothetical protein